ncbi:hypothetical protein [Actinocrispum sp. NPDC049592]|uniref:hypothetical protein n=1 Tax=Actinocrispum sp. NPDC049592 TaxID=3154835 RepID=UPI00343B7ECA
MSTAPPGTSTMIDDVRKNGPNTAMTVAGDRDKLEFYRNVMHFPFAAELGGKSPFGRGYISFDQLL